MYGIIYYITVVNKQQQAIQINQAKNFTALSPVFPIQNSTVNIYNWTLWISFFYSVAKTFLTVKNCSVMLISKRPNFACRA